MRMVISYRGLLFMIAVAGLAVGIAFGGGIAYGRNTAPETIVTVTASGSGTTGQSSATTGSASDRLNQLRAQGVTPGQNPGAGISGTVKSIEGNVLTVSRESGDTKVQVGENTVICKVETGALSDIKPGASIVATGQPNAEGTVVATSIQITSASSQGAAP